jgi:EF-P beta-lysylation protein EpmB
MIVGSQLETLLWYYNRISPTVYFFNKHQEFKRVQKKHVWQEALSDLITDPKELLNILELDPTLLDAAFAAAQKFPLKVTRSFASRIQKGNINDPLLKQILPLGIELNITPGYIDDPLEEKKVNPVPGLLHKYHGRVLITLTSACAVHCRYCFRRNFPYAENNPGTSGWERIFNYIKNDTSITEVILSGGDPLAVSDKLLQLFTSQLALIPQVKRLRFHTRIPVVLPERITQEFIDWISQLPLDVVMVIHANHAQEISEEVKQAMLGLRNVGVQLLNQAVLLKDVNNNVEALKQLNEELFSVGVLPYYLHVLDKVQGVAHFDLPIEEAYALHAALSRELPGYLVPRLACEEAGEPHKTILSTALFTG